MQTGRIIVFILVLFVSKVYAQNVLTKTTSINQLFLLNKSGFPESDLTFNIFDSIKSPIYTRVSLSNLRGSLGKNSKSGYKIVMTSPVDALIYFNFDSVVGIIKRTQIDSSIWYGRLKCIDKKSKKELLNFNNNLLVGNNDLILLFTNNTPIFRKRASVEKIEDVTRIKILDDSLRFKELLFLSVNFKEPTTSVMISYSEKYKCDFVNTYVVNKDFVGALLGKTIGGVLSMYHEYIDSRSFILQYPVSFFKLINYRKYMYRLDRRILWLYHEDFFLNPFSPTNCCD
ncbi:MAG: hypothetical protein J0L69_09965 [Bacteroidetes bacterium]|nr:hypothetical protein [Bacteroidota bacterium]